MKADDTERIVKTKLGELGKRVRAARKRRGLTVKAVAQSSGIGQSTVKAIEAGRPYNIVNLSRMLHVFGMISELDGLVVQERDFMTYRRDGKSSSAITDDDFDDLN